jgi:hypothetical protein
MLSLLCPINGIPNMLPYQPIYNMLELADHYDWYCSIRSYSVGHHEMLITATHSAGQKFFIHVGHVFCFSGPVGWKGAMLCKGSKDQYLEFIHEMIPGYKGTEDELLDLSRYGELFVFLAEDCRIRIIAVSVEKYDSTHPLFRDYP